MQWYASHESFSRVEIVFNVRLQWLWRMGRLSMGAWLSAAHHHYEGSRWKVRLISQWSVWVVLDKEEEEEG